MTDTAPTRAVMIAAIWKSTHRDFRGGKRGKRGESSASTRVGLQSKVNMAKAKTTPTITAEYLIIRRFRAAEAEYASASADCATYFGQIVKALLEEGDFDGALKTVTKCPDPDTFTRLLAQVHAVHPRAIPEA